MQKLHKQGYVGPGLYVCHHELVDHYEIYIFSNDNGHFPFYVDLFFSPSATRLLPDLTI